VNGSFLDDFDLDGSQDLTDVVLANAPAPEPETLYNTPTPQGDDSSAEHKAPPATAGNGPTQEQFETLQGQLRETQALMQAQMAAAQQQQQAYRYQQQAPQQFNTTPDPNVKQQLTDQFYQDPVNFTIQTARAMAEQMVSQQTGDVRLGMAENVIHNFKTEKRTNDPTYKAVEKHFEQALSEIQPQQLAQMGPEQARQALSWAYRAAQGDVYATLAAKQRAKTPPPTPPMYGGGGFGAAPSAPATGDDADTRMAKYLGLSQADFDAIQE